MITLTWKKMNEKSFIQSILILNSLPIGTGPEHLDRITAYRVGRILEVGRRELSKAHDLEITKAKELAELDDKGRMVMVDIPGGKAGDKRPKVHPDNEVKLEEYMNKLFDDNVVEIKVHKLDFNNITGLNGEQLMAIQDICDNLPAE